MKLVKSILVFVGIGMIVIPLVSLLPIGGFEKGWFSGIIVVVLFDLINK